MRDVLNEFLRPQSPLWPEVKLFLSMCKTAAQRLPMEVQVSNIMNVRRGLKRLSRLKGDEDPSEIQALLQWITDRSEIAGAFCLQRLKIGHQVNWICALLASIARIRQFCSEALEKIKNRGAKKKRNVTTDMGCPLDRSSFYKLRKTTSFAVSPSTATESTEEMTAFAAMETLDSSGASTTAVRITRSKSTRPAETPAVARKRSKRTTPAELLNDAKDIREDITEELSTAIGSQRPGGRISEIEADLDSPEVSRVKNHPRMLKLKRDIKEMIKANSDLDKKASLKKVYGIALKRSLKQPVTEDNIEKVCKLAMKKARTYCK